MNSLGVVLVLCMAVGCSLACLCPLDLRQVCGVDGVTYANECSMKCVKVELHKTGPCPICPVPKIYSPVCGENGYTYGNRQEAECLGVDIEHEGACTSYEKNDDE